MPYKMLAYEDVVKSDNPDFNHRAARAFYNIISKMDPESARMFSYIVVSDIMEKTIDDNLPLLQRHLNQVIEKRITKVVRATSSLVAKGERSDEALNFAYALAMFSKAQKNPYDRGYRFKESDFSRDPGTGRFRTKVVTRQQKPIHDETANSLGLPNSKDKVTAKGQRNLNDNDLARYQDQYRQLGNFLAAVRASGQPGDHDVIAHIRNRYANDEDSDYTTTINSSSPKKGLWDPSKEDLVGLDARPRNLTAGGAAFGLMGALGGRGTEQSNQAWVNAANTADTRMGSFSEDWTKTYDPKVDNAKLYGRISSGGSLLEELAPPGSGMQSAGRVAQFVGDHGSDAEAVFGPTARKTAYRYRGVTRKPEADLLTAWNSNVQSSKMRNLPGNLSPVQMAAQRESTRRRPPTEEEKIAGRQAVVGWLKTRAPRKGYYNLQLASGTTPPSEGVLMDKDGKVVAQAVGYGDDHYLPFNLNQLGKLNGGEYIRSRSVGGLTTEDIYTGLMTGAKRVTVTSRSGTFTLEFQDDIKGRKRAFNDKARRMSSRYAQLLDAVQSQQVDAQDVSPEVRRAIRSEVQEEFAGYGSGAEMSKEVARRVREFKENPEFSESDERLVNFMAQQDPRQLSVDANQLRREITSELAAEKEFKFRLNGNGYAAALKSLEEQFPYYIKVDSKPYREEHSIETEIDQGYVAPDRNRPRAASAGLFGDLRGTGAHTEGGKFSAQEANFQGGRGGAPSPSVEGAAAAVVAKPEVKGADEMRAKIATQQATATYVTAAQQMQGKLRDAVASDALGLNDEQLRTVNMTAEELSKPENQQKLDSLVNTVASSAYGKNLGETLVSYRAAAGHIGRQPFTQDRVGVWPEKPAVFGEAAYQAGARPEVRNRELIKMDQESRGAVSTDRALSTLSDDELRGEHNMLLSMRGIMDTAAYGASTEGLPLADKVSALKGIGLHEPVTPAAQKLMANPSLINRQLEMVQRVRTLNMDVPVTERGAKDHGKDPGDIVVHDRGPAATPTRQEEAARVQRSVDGAIASFERAVAYYKPMGPNGEIVANALAATLNDLRHEKDNILDQQSWDMFREANETAFHTLETAPAVELPPEEPEGRDSILR